MACPWFLYGYETEKVSQFSSELDNSCLLMVYIAFWGCWETE